MIVAVVAHPDDESLIAGGTLARAADAGLATGVVSLTRGELGPIADPALASRATLGAVREAELAAAGSILGLGFTRCLRLPDGELPWVDETVAVDALCEVLTEARPEVILTFGEDGVYHHPDHAAAGRLAHAAAARLGGVDLLEAVWAPEALPALVAAARARELPADVWGLEPEAFGSDRAPTVRVDVRRVLPRKLAALRAHRTQISSAHLLTALPLELAESHLGHEGWYGPRSRQIADLLDDG